MEHARNAPREQEQISHRDNVLILSIQLVAQTVKFSLKLWICANNAKIILDQMARNANLMYVQVAKAFKKTELVKLMLLFVVV